MSVTVEQMWKVLNDHPETLPVKISTLADIMEVPAEKVADLFLDLAIKHPGTSVTFRYPLLPCPAIVALDPLPLTDDEWEKAINEAAAELERERRPREYKL